MKRLIHVLTDNNIGGAGRWLLNELRYTDRNRYDVTVLLPPSSLLRAEVAALGVPLLSLDGMRDRSWDAPMLGKMTALFRQEKPDIVHVGASLTARIAARSAGVPLLVMTKHCAAKNCGSLGKIIHRIVDSTLTDAVIAVSQSVADGLLQSGTPKKLLHTIPNGITLQTPYREAERAALREKYGMDEAHLWVGIAARLEPVKGVDLFLAMARRLLAVRDDLRFIVFGDGSQAAELKNSVADLGEKIRFAGFTQEIEQSLGLLDINVVSSRSEAFCLSLLEGMSMGTPAVGFAVGGIPEAIRDGKTGLLATPGDTAMLAEKVAYLADDDALRRSCGENGRQMVLQEYLAEKMVRSTETLYEQLCSKQS